MRTREANKALAFGVVAVVVAMLLAVVFTARPAHAKTFTVNSTSDSNDGACSPFSLFTECSLREAISAANSNNNVPTVDTIAFNILGTGVQTLTPDMLLPPISEPVTIDGYTQRPCSSNPAPCSKPNTNAQGSINANLLIELDGSDAGNGASGLSIQASNSVIKGLVINDFATAGIVCGGNATGIKVRGNFIGTDATGTAAEGNAYGVWTEGDNNLIGGEVPAARNVISKNTNHGIVLGIFGPSSGNKVQGNLIQSNGTHGVAMLSGSNNLIGGAASAANTSAFNNFLPQP